MKKLLNINFLFILVLTFPIGSQFAYAQLISNKKSKKHKSTKEKTLSQKELRKAEGYFLDGEKYFMLEDYNKSLILFEQSFEIYPENAAVSYKLAQVYKLQNQPEKALTYALNALALNGSNKFYYLMASSIYTKLGQYEEASEIYSKMIKKIDDTDKYLFELAALYVIQKKTKKALETYNRIEKALGVMEETISQKQKIYLNSNKLKEAIEEGQKLIEAYPHVVRYRLALVEIMASNGKYKKAIDLLKETLEKHPGNATAQIFLYNYLSKINESQSAHLYLIQAFANEKLNAAVKVKVLAGMIANANLDEEKQLLKTLADTLVKVHPTEANAYAINGDMYFNLGEKRKAIQFYKSSLAYDDSNFNIWQNTITMELDDQQLDSAIYYADRAIDLFPNQATLYYFSGTARLIKKDYKESVILFTYGKKMAAGNPDLKALFNGQLGDACNGLKQFKKSSEYYEAAIEHSPDNYYLLNNYSYYLSLRKEKLEYAKRMSYKVIKNNPNNPSYLDTYAWVLYMLGDYKEARKYLEIAIEQQKDGEISGVITEHYGDVLFKLGEKNKAILQWKRAKDLKDASDSLDKKIADRTLYEK